MATSQKGSTADQKVRSVSKKRYSKLQAEYNAELDKYNSCDMRVQELKLILQNRKVVTVDKKGKEVEVELRTVQLVDYSKELWDKKQELFDLENKLKRLGSSLGSAAKKTKTATKTIINKKREKIRLANEGQRNLSAITSHVADLFTKTLKSDAEIASLKTLATTNGKKFHLEFLKKLRKELKDVTIKAWVVASPKIQGELSRLVRGLYGYRKA